MEYKLQIVKRPGKDLKKIFFVGIKGVGTAPLAIIAKQAGYMVAGSDINEEFITDNSLQKEKITIYNDFLIEDIGNFFGTSPIDACLVVTTGAHKGFDNPQVKWAKNEGINVLTQGQALALFMEGEVLHNSQIKSVAIAGSHGKTTIASLLCSTLFSLGQDPTFAVGTGEIFPLGSPGHLGHGIYFIAEADEYASEPIYDRIPKFLYQSPNFAIFNNIDFDHPDLFTDINEVIQAFYAFAYNIKSNGKLFVNGDDKYLKNFKENINKDIKIITYGEKMTNDYVITKIMEEEKGLRFTVMRRGIEIGVFELSLFGIYNAVNALAVIAFLMETGFEYLTIRQALRVFTGSKRRCERVGNMVNGAVVIDDYAHHPLEILTTLKSIQNKFFDKKIICVFQPHTYSRTKSLLPEFANAFKNIHKLILLPIFKSQRDTEKDTILLSDYVDAHKNVVDTNFFDQFDDVVEYVRQNYSSSDYVVVTMGAGDVYKIGYKLINS